MPFWALSMRAFILYIFLIFATRFMRQRQVSILAGHNYIVVAGIVSLAAVRMVVVNKQSGLPVTRSHMKLPKKKKVYLLF